MATHDEIIEKHAQAARAEIEAEAAKTNAERRAEALQAELGTLSAQIQEQQRQPTRYKAELTASLERQAAMLKELDTLGALPKVAQPSGNRHGFLVRGSTYANFDPRRSNGL